MHKTNRLNYANTKFKKNEICIIITNTALKCDYIYSTNN